MATDDRKFAAIAQKAAAWYHFEVYHQMLSAERADKYKDVYRRWAREAQVEGAKRSAAARRLMGIDI